MDDFGGGRGKMDDFGGGGKVCDLWSDDLIGSFG